MRKYLITGLVILLPVAVTIGIVIFIVDFLTKPFMGAVTSWLSSSTISQHGFYFLSSEHVIRVTSQLIILICLFLVTLFIGIVTRWFFVRTLLHWSDQILNKIPLVNKVYKTTQEVIQTLFSAEKNTFQHVVLCPFPLGGYIMGMVSRDAPNVCRDATCSELLSVFVPTTPNPTSGYLLMFKKEELIYIDMSIEDAVKYCVSCGVIVPQAGASLLKSTSQEPTDPHE
ncbi:MAG: hypothetical protein S4CHLAM102_10570 [Chlamydiia bacterium]|nr:hypothetical protein [Chlamydiia bacterium]